MFPCCLVFGFSQLALFSCLFLFLKLYEGVPSPLPLPEISQRVQVLRQIENFSRYSQEFAPDISRRTTMRVSTKKPASTKRNYDKTIAHKRITTRPNTTPAVEGTKKNSKKRLSLVVAILSAPIRFDRREGIRVTWMKECKQSGLVVCRFFTDRLSDMKPRVRKALLNENRTNNDLEFMPIPKGYNFGRRMLWLMEWSAENYDFDYFLRVDDDYFVCLKKLLLELPHRPEKRSNIF